MQFICKHKLTVTYLYFTTATGQIFSLWNMCAYTCLQTHKTHSTFTSKYVYTRCIIMLAIYLLAINVTPLKTVT